MWIHFDGIPIGTWFTLIFLAPVYRKVNHGEAESQNGVIITADYITELTSGYVYISALFTAPIKQYP